MKQIAIIIFLFPALLFGQWNKQTSAWVGENNEYLYISRELATFIRGNEIQQFDVEKSRKKSFVLAKTYYVPKKINQAELLWLKARNKVMVLPDNTCIVEEYEKQGYKVVFDKNDTLKFFPDCNDIFQLGQQNVDPAYVFVKTNKFPSEPTHFVKIHFETTVDVYLKFIVDIHYTRGVRVQIIDDYNVEKLDIKAPLKTREYYRLLAILAHYDILSFPDEYKYEEPEDIKCCNSLFEIEFQGQIKKCKSCSYFPFECHELERFLYEVIEKRETRITRYIKL